MRVSFETLSKNVINEAHYRGSVASCIRRDDFSSFPSFFLFYFPYHALTYNMRRTSVRRRTSTPRAPSALIASAAISAAALPGRNLSFLRGPNESCCDRLRARAPTGVATHLARAAGLVCFASPIWNARVAAYESAAERRIGTSTEFEQRRNIVRPMLLRLYASFSFSIPFEPPGGVALLSLDTRAISRGELHFRAFCEKLLVIFRVGYKIEARPGE